MNRLYLVTVLFIACQVGFCQDSRYSIQSQALGTGLTREQEAEYNYLMAMGFLKGVTPELAEPFFVISANDNHPIAQYYNGYYREQKYGDKTGAEEWYRKSAIQGYAPAQYAMYYHYLFKVADLNSPAYSYGYNQVNEYYRHDEYAENAVFWLTLAGLNKNITALGQFDFITAVASDEIRRKAMIKAFQFYRQVDEKGNSVLQRAVYFDNREMVNYLLDEDFSVNYANKEGNTSLHLARSVEVAELLLKHGGDLYAKNNYGESPLDRANMKYIGSDTLARYYTYWINSYAETPSDAAGYIQSGIVYFNREQYTNALPYFEKALLLEPDSKKALLYKALTNRKLYNYQQAITDFTKLIAADPGNQEAYYERATTWFFMSEYQKAINDYDRAISLNDKNVNAYCDKGNAWVYLQKFDEAITAFNHALSVDSGNYKAMVGRGVTYAWQQKNNEALADLKKAILINPVGTQAYYNLGIIYSNIGNNEEAELNFLLTSILKPSYNNVFKQLGSIRKTLKKPTEALNDYAMAISYNPGDAELYEERASLFADLTQTDSCIEVYSSLIKLKPQQAEYYNKRGNQYWKKAEYEKSLADYASAIQHNPKESVYYYNRGGAYRKLMQTDLAIGDYSMAIKLDPGDHAAYYERSICQQEKNNLAGALNDIRKALELSPDNQKYQSFLNELESAQAGSE